MKGGTLSSIWNVSFLTFVLNCFAKLARQGARVSTFLMIVAASVLLQACSLSQSDQATIEIKIPENFHAGPTSVEIEKQASTLRSLNQPVFAWESSVNSTKVSSKDWKRRISRAEGWAYTKDGPVSLNDLGCLFVHVRGTEIPDESRLSCKSSGDALGQF